jgi:hypothetical protein
MKSWALITTLLLSCALSSASVVVAQEKGEAPKVELKQQQKRLALFLDGTWNEVESNTNVWRMKALCAPTGTDGKHAPAGLCSRSSTRAAIIEAYISKLSQLGASRRDDFVVHGKQGGAVLCSISFELKPLTRESMAQMDKDYKEPTSHRRRTPSIYILDAAEPIGPCKHEPR